MGEDGIELSDADSCEEDLGTDPDPWAKWQCMVARAVAENLDGTWAQKLKEANADIAAQDFSAESIKWWLPTRQIKTFHPRTPGMHAYRDSIVAVIKKVNANANAQEDSSSDDGTDRAPMSGSDPVCHSAEDVPDHGVVDPGAVLGLAEDACGSIGGKFLQFDAGPDKFYEERELHGVLYQYRVSYIEGCGSTRMKLPNTVAGQREIRLARVSLTRRLRAAITAVLGDMLMPIVLDSRLLVVKGRMIRDRIENPLIKNMNLQR